MHLWSFTLQTRQVRGWTREGERGKELTRVLQV
jgi:hypothetical protein